MSLLSLRNSLLLVVLNCSLAAGQIHHEYLKNNDYDAVILNDRYEFVINSLNDYKEKREYSILLKSKKANSLKDAFVYYDDSRVIQMVNLQVQYLNGNKTKNYKEKDFEDWSLGQGDIASSSRIKYIDPTITSYPAVVTFRYEKSYNEAFSFPTWLPQKAERVYLNKGTFIVTIPEEYNLRYKQQKINDPVITKFDGKTTFQWNLDSISAFEFEPFNKDITYYTPKVELAPSSIIYGSVKGDLSSWNGFGKYQNELNAYQDDLTDEMFENIKTQIDNEGISKQELLQNVYNFLQNKTRYVSIQLGIGGLMPFSSSFVHEKSYGDCKALSFYTQSILKRFNIDSYYTIIYGGANPPSIDPAFVQDKFNHVILAVPTENDTTYLECTSQTNPFGYMGTFTSNRKALMVTPEGGELIETPEYNYDENIIRSEYKIFREENSDAKVNLTRMTQGLGIEDKNLLQAYTKSTTEQSKWIIDNFNFGQTELKEFEILPLEEGFISKAGFKASFNVYNESKVMGKRAFLSLEKYYSKRLTKIVTDTITKPIIVKYGFSYIDNLLITKKEGERVESKISELHLESKYGSYHLTFEEKEDEIYIQRKFVIKKGEFFPSDFLEYKQFINQVVKADNQSIVLSKDT